MAEPNEFDPSKLLSPTALQFFNGRQEERQATVESLKTAKYWLVVVPGGDDPAVLKVDNLEGLLRKLHKMDGKDTQVYIFPGQRLHFTTAPKRMLVLTDNTAINIETGITVIRRDDDPEFALQRDAFMGDANLYDLLPVKTNEEEDEEMVSVVEDDFD